MNIEQINLQGGSPGRVHALTVYRFASDATGPKLYVQAGLHADEPPGMLVAHALIARFASLEAQGQLLGEVIVVPAANPIGLGQSIMGQAFGRFSLSDGVNFNRGFAELGAGALRRLRGELKRELGPVAASNQAVLRRALVAECADIAAVGESAHLRKLLMSLALPCETVLDLHCDGESVLHIYTGTTLASACAPLADAIGAQAVLTAEVSGDNPFDESMSRPWWEVPRALSDVAFLSSSEGCVSATVELRGEADVTDALAAQDALAIVRFAQIRGVVAAGVNCGATERRAQVDATPLAAVEPLVAPISGVIVFDKSPGDWVEANERVARMVDPLSGEAADVCASRAGLLYARVSHRTTLSGRRIAKIAGKQAFRDGLLLSP